MARPHSAAIVDVPAPIAAWLVSFGAIRDGNTVLNAHNQEIRQLRPSEWVDIQNGKVRTALPLPVAAHGRPAQRGAPRFGAGLPCATPARLERGTLTLSLPQQVGAILAKVFMAHGQPNPVPPMRDGEKAWRGAWPQCSTRLVPCARSACAVFRLSHSAHRCALFHQVMRLPFGCTTGMPSCLTCIRLASTSHRMSKRSWLLVVSAAAGATSSLRGP